MIWGGIMYTKIEEAMLFAFKANKGKKVKINNVDKTFDNIAVYSLMKDICEAEDVLVASLLHDVINDTEYGYEEIEELFGTLVADMVSDLSEDMSIAKWMDRKKDFVKRMKNNYDINVINIMVAVKLYDLLSYYDYFLQNGDKLWKLSSGDKNENCWLFREIYNIGKKKNADSNLLNRYKELLIVYFGEFDEEV